jgi:5-methylcytosine-specific restriction endonuclease McrA
MKECRTCKTELPLNEFPKNATAADGHRNFCKPCHSAKTKASDGTPERVEFLKEYNATPERKKGKAKSLRKWYGKNPFSVMANNANARHLRRGHPEWPQPTPTDIEKCWIESGGKCQICFTQIELGNGPSAPNAAVLDALDSSKPYATGNINFLCAPCNIRKSDHTLETAQRLVEFLTEKLNGKPHTDH